MVQPRRGSCDGDSRAPPAGCDTALGTSPDEVLARWLLEEHARGLDGSITDLDTLTSLPDVVLDQVNEVLLSIAWNYARRSEANLINPILSSIVVGCVDAVEMLIRCGAPIHDVSGKGMPALNCCLAAATPVSRLLVSNVSGFASKPDHLGVAQCLLKHGADPTSEACDGKGVETPLCYARRHGGDLHEFVVLLEAHPKVQRALKRRTCANCEGEGSLLAPPFQKCACCERLRYCSRDCQIMHWKRAHRGECQPKASLAG